jgi:hypothetical protein
MVDRTRTEEAIVEAVGFYDDVEEAMPDAFRVLVAAVRAVVEAPEVRWCEFHGNKMATADSCFSGLYYGSLKGVCRPIKVFLVPAEEGS